MGNKDSRTYKPPPFKKESWTEIKASRQASKPEHGRYRLLINNLTNEQLQQYLVSFFNLAEFQKYLEFFQWREREDNIVNTKYLNYELSKEFCNTNYTAKVYIEHIPVRLSDIQDIPYPENLYVLFSSLQGFEKLYQSVGYFKVTEDLICMDKDGRVKVWLHSDLSQCHPSGRSLDEISSYRRQDTLQAKMVDEIVRLVEENTAQDIEPGMTVSQFIRHNHKGKALNFKLIKQEIINYAQKYDAEIPNYFESVIGIFDQERSDNDEQSAQQLAQPVYLHDQPQKIVAVQNWQSAHMPRGSDDKYTEKMVNETPSYEKVFSVNPSHQYDYRPNSAVFQYQPRENAFPVQEHEEIMARSQPTAEIEYRTRAQSPLGTMVIPLQVGSINNSNLKVNFNYQSLPPRRDYPNPVSPISQLVTPLPIMRKVTSLPHQTDRPEHPEQTFDAKLVLSSSLKNLLTNNKLLYSDSTSTYQLDSQLAEDMVRYLST